MADPDLVRRLVTLLADFGYYDGPRLPIRNL
jgi:hypothetical protein